MDDVRGLFLGMPQGTTPAAVTTNKNIIMSSFKSRRDIQKKEGGPDIKLAFNNKHFVSQSTICLLFKPSKQNFMLLRSIVRKRNYIEFISPPM